MSSHDFENVDHFTVGAVGEPGHRLFLMQFATGEQLLTLKVEKQQVAALCKYMGELLSDLPSPGHLPEDLDLRGPLDVAWVAGSIAVNYDEITDRMVMEVEEFGLTEAGDIVDDDYDGAAETSSVRVVITREQAAAVTIHGTSLVESGRPPCPLCGFPLDPTGHACPRTNGHRPPQL